uniref:Uncharacterized protein n=1 Tax=Labrus bergylta TaxID=56723 RepID=A0A3Q3F3A3_9LABR
MLPNQQRPSRVPTPFPVTVIQVACGDVHSLALTKGGDVLSWGLNSHGQLGLGKDMSLKDKPVLVRALTGVAVTQVSAGATHSFFLTLPGLVYCCGANESGQLGLDRVDEKGTNNLHSLGYRHTCLGLFLKVEHIDYDQTISTRVSQHHLQAETVTDFTLIPAGCCGLFYK